MKLKNKHLYYLAGLVIAFITFIPPLPRGLKYLLALIPILAFGSDLTLMYMKEFFERKYLTRNIIAVVVVLGMIVTGKLSYAAVAAVFSSAASYYFDKLYSDSTKKIDELSRIIPAYARHADSRKIPLKNVVPGMPIVLKQGDIIPCDCNIVSGEAAVDYTNIFGAGAVRTVKAGMPCISGGILQAGSLNAVAQKAPRDSFAAMVSHKTKKAHTPSNRYDKVMGLASLAEYAIAGLAVLFFIVLMAVTGDFPLSINIASVILLTAPCIGITAVLPLLSHNAVVSARRRGVIFADILALEHCGDIQTLSPNEQVSDDLLTKIEETGVVPAKNGNTQYDAVLYRNASQLDADQNPCFKLGLGFFSKNSDATAIDGKVERCVGAIRTARNYKTVFYQNLICLGVEKLAVIALAFFLNITPVAAIVIEFICIMLCLMNASRDNM